ncbi:recombinase RecA [bacterium]|nr:recombinase RecA [bacterium]MDC0897373.1 recombinase RecA [Thermodesulfobacteriota bacterium]MDG2005710.1 recombinase RecA [Thermodesulfobacteriota bacterium]NSX00715.1 recombinase RecA [bacterium]
MTENKKKVPSKDADENKQKALDATISTIEKQFGKGAIMRMDNESTVKNVEAISTGSIGLDHALGVGGFPRGRVIEVYGPEASGKTTLALHAIAETQRSGGITAFVDAEHAFDPTYAKGLGIKNEDLLISQPDYGEQALEIVDQLIRSSAVDMIVIDSVSALTPKAELDGEMGDTHVGLQARLMSQALRKITATVSKSKTTVIFINQLRMKIGVPSYMSPETTSGGNALKFYCSVRLDVRRIASLKTSESVIGNRVRVKVVKNKVAPPFREAEMDIIFGRGISKFGELIDLGVEFGLVEKAGAWFSYSGERIGQGKDNAQKFLQANSDLGLKLEKEVREKISSK